MSKSDQLRIDQEELVQAWSRTLPTVLDASDQAKVWADGVHSNALRVHITTAGRSLYSFDFKCTYVDSREVQVELVDVERDGRNVDERTDIIQTLVDDYVRHLHECAQQLHALTTQ
ncbi:hypothetical protein [Paenibacillus puerhi]|uniref:hypothetical protein n=1 Tax=Paenibacillus puerhi TaxID=2692622 RepID=UPI00135AF316|nr:hypothetical protein [Paenibacillus puerhi]